MTALMAATAIAVAGCSSSAKPTPTPIAYGGPAYSLVEVDAAGVAFTGDFNPFDASSMASQLSLRSLTYEPLFEFNTLNPAQIHPWLGTAYSFDGSGRDLTVTVRKNVRFSDGTALTPGDVAFTFELIRSHPEVGGSGVPQQSADPTISGQTVTLHFAAPAFADLYGILGETLIVPQRIWSTITDPTTATITDPIGTGPFVFSSFSTQVIKFAPNRHYWGGTPPEAEIDVPDWTNAAAGSAWEAGTLDWSGIAPSSTGYCQEGCGDGNPAINHAWFAPAATTTLWFNLSGPDAAPAIEDPQVRLAISAGIDRTALAELGESGYEQPATSSSGLILPAQSAYLTAAQTGDLEAESDPAKVASILTADGYTAPTDPTGTCTSIGGAAPTDLAACYTKEGQAIVFAVEGPVPVPDVWEDDQLIVSELDSEGIAAWPDGDGTVASWTADYQSGDFQSMVHAGAGGPTPYVQLQNWLDDGQPISAGDYGRYQSAAAQTALATLQDTNPDDTAAVTTAVQVLTNIVSTQAPVVPLLYGVDWDLYSTARYTGWPDAANPYMDPSPGDPQLPYILMHLRMVE
jgi:peptide/nickel transport system substrate-binding protein